MARPRVTTMTGLLTRPVAAVGLAVLAGISIATQAFVNGQLGTSLGSPLSAAVVNQAVAVLALTLVGLGTGALRRAWRQIRAGAAIRRWHLAVCVISVLNVTVASAAAPRLGVALLAVAVVAGQCMGGLLADRLGLTPRGRRDLTLERVGSAGLALAAVAVGAATADSGSDITLMSLAFLGGMGFPFLQAGVGQIAILTREPLAAAQVCFSLAAVATALVAMGAVGVAPPHGWLAASPGEWVGGLLGAAAVVIIAVTVPVLGALQLTLAIVAGQTMGGLGMDIVAPVRGRPVSELTAVTVVFVLSAVWVSGGARTARRRSGRETEEEKAGESGAAKPRSGVAGSDREITAAPGGGP